MGILEPRFYARGGRYQCGMRTLAKSQKGKFDIGGVFLCLPGHLQLGFGPLGAGFSHLWPDVGQAGREVIRARRFRRLSSALSGSLSESCAHTLREAHISRSAKRPSDIDPRRTEFQESPRTAFVKLNLSLAPGSFSQIFTTRNSSAQHTLWMKLPSKTVSCLLRAPVSTMP